MKSSILFYFIICIVALVTISCNNKNTDARTQNSPNFTPAGQGATVSEAHYRCPNGCVGSGSDSEGNCPVCGAKYEHNVAYHQQQMPDPQAAADQGITTNTGTPSAEGQFHYTCPNGCEGGLDNDGLCPKCGAQLAHNTAFHGQAGTDPNHEATQMPQMNTQGAGGAFHYTCPNGCEGGAGGAGSCANCGAQLVHNQSFHNQQMPAGATTMPGGPPIQQSDANSPAQNTAGVYHYICSNGCEGGSSQGGVCAKCGSPLTHNAAYHQ